MIRLTDAFVLAYTKLRVHKIRTGLTAGIAGLLFGVMLVAVIVVQGVFDSVDRFSGEGLNSRTVLTVTRSAPDLGFNEWEMADDPDFVAEVEVAHKALVDTKRAAAKKYNVPYDAPSEDPSPIGIDPDTKQRIVTEQSLGSQSVQDIVTKRRSANTKPFIIADYLKKYPSAKVLGDNNTLMPMDGFLEYMKDGKEANQVKNTREIYMSRFTDDTVSLQVLDGSLTKPFLTTESFDPSRGEVPVVIPFGQAAKLLGLQPLDKNASTEEKLNRLSEVRQRIGEITASFCYRNQASIALFGEATQQATDIKRNENNKEYVKPALLYTLPSAGSCGAVTVASDKRTAEEKKTDANYELYQKEIGVHLGEPVQHKVVVRGVGVSSDVASEAGSWSIATMVESLLGSSLGYGTWSIPADLLAQLPKDQRPEAIFKTTANDIVSPGGMMGYQSYLVEFGDKAEARQLLQDTGMLGGGMIGDVWAAPFGSGVLLVDEARRIFIDIMMWAGLVIGVVAIIILSGLIGRTVADGRRESAVFRAIGATRVDIGRVYGMFAFLLAVRIAAFALLMGIALALTVELLWWQDATFGARLAYAAKSTDIEFHLFSLMSWYVPAILGVIIVVGLVASIIPILLGARRNPINDMRNDT